MKKLLHLIIIVILTVFTQIGGIIYLMTILIVKSNSENKRIKRFLTFSIIYLFATFVIVPYLAKSFGREKVKETEIIKANTFFTKLLNRNYVKPELNRTLEKISIDFEKKQKGINLVYLDANFPFIDKFPLLPHLSHNDGRKIDLSLIYKLENGEITNKKPSISGYGVYENPRENEIKQFEVCREKGYWQYDFPKYLTFGKINRKIQFSDKATSDLINSITKQPEIGKIFIEPHLKNRMKLMSNKIRFQGCRAVRHDDHIHIQLK
ncbi:hypothetical protein MHL31_02965 [Lutibacter sp. A80]|uniref:hypothetical protein n=1 Tax=Lutibacter sp. A80 TaxID=2918453 RepID=UPI001F052F0B|nr:hypothetical protein [Lutibacter sp. A80]UMB61174.1 hypothetical protein MHL31_02965 [Lutibacter sp. A80]